VHHRTRLGILAVLREVDRAEFGYPRDALGLTDGNLSRHLRTLEAAGHIQVRKGYQGKRPRTWLRLTTQGTDALDRSWRRCGRWSPAWTTSQAPRQAQLTAPSPPRPDNRGAVGATGTRCGLGEVAKHGRSSIWAGGVGGYREVTVTVEDDTLPAASVASARRV
jgi:DNA-binding MarR family transcriptional regulator